MKKNGLMKFSLLSISLVLTSSGAIAADIPAIAKAFPTQSVSSIQLLITIPGISVVIFVLLSSFISKILGEKQTVILGLFIALFSSIIPIFSDNYTAILISRIFLGVGFGLFNSLAVSLIGFFFDGYERTKLVGFQNAFQSIGLAVMTYLVGILININWHMTFCVYLIIIPIIIFFVFFVPSTKRPENANEETEKTKLKQTTNWHVILYLLIFVILLIISAPTNLDLALLFVHSGYGTATDASTVLSIGSLVGMLAGFSFGVIFKKINHFVLPASFILTALSLLLIAVSNNVLMASVGAVAATFFGCFAMPYLFNQALNVSPKGSETLSVSLLLVGANIGGAISPYGIKLLSILSGTTKINGIFVVSAIAFIILAIIFLIYVFKIRKSQSMPR